MKKSANFFFAPPGDIEAAGQGVAVATFMTGAIALLTVLVALFRPGTGVLPSVPTTALIGIAACMGGLAYGVYRRLRSAAVLLASIYFLSAVLMPLPRVVGILLFLFSVAGARGTFVLRSNPSLERP